MSFLIENWMLILIALSSGVMLLLPHVVGGASAGISPSEVVALINKEKAIVVDVCAADEFSKGHVSGARNLPLQDLASKLPDTAKNKSLPVVMVCASGVRSTRAVGIAKKLGYEKVFSLKGGFAAWKEAGLPVRKG